MGDYQRGQRHAPNGTTWRADHGERPAGHVGIELEIGHPDGYRRLLELLPDASPRTRPSVERDGSLNQQYCAEIVFPPIPVSSIKSKRSFFGRAIKALHDGGARAYSTCGMHINVSTKDWSSEKIGAFCATINQLITRKLEAVGGRQLNRWCLQVARPSIDEYLDGTRGATAWRGNRVECRFPYATADQKRIAFIVDFLGLVAEFAEENHGWMNEALSVHDRLYYFHGPTREKFTNKFIEFLTDESNSGNDVATLTLKVFEVGYAKATATPKPRSKKGARAYHGPAAVAA